MEEDGIEDELPEKYDKVPSYIVSFLIKFFSYAMNKVQSKEGQRLFELALVNLRFHPLIPKTNCDIEFRIHDITYSVIYTDCKIELSEYISVDSGMGWDHFQSLRMCYLSSGESKEEGDFDEFNANIYEALDKKLQIEPSDEE